MSFCILNSRSAWPPSLINPPLTFEKPRLDFEEVGDA
jgi:hypothetical protein